MNETIDQTRERFQQLAEDAKSSDEAVEVQIEPIEWRWRATLAIRGSAGTEIHSLESTLEMVRGDFPATLRACLDVRHRRQKSSDGA
jgi:hypothetical protein